MSDYPESRCPVCGTPGRLVQGDTLHYEPSEDTVPAENERLRAIVLEFMRYEYHYGMIPGNLFERARAALAAGPQEG